MIELSGADLVLPDRIVSPGTLVIEGGRIVSLRPGTTGTLHHHYIVPGFIDLHVHGVDGVDVLDGTGACSTRWPRDCRDGASPRSVPRPWRARRGCSVRCWTRFAARAKRRAAARRASCRRISKAISSTPRIGGPNLHTVCGSRPPRGERRTRRRRIGLGTTPRPLSRATSRPPTSCVKSTTRPRTSPS